MRKSRMKSDTPETHPGTEALTYEGDLAKAMVSGIDVYFQGLMLKASKDRDQRRFTQGHVIKSRDDYMMDKRTKLKNILAVEWPDSVPDLLEIIPATVKDRSPLAQSDAYTIKSVQWTVNPHLDGEGLLIEPMGTPIADVIALPDCDEWPEDLAGLNHEIPKKKRWIQKLAQQGCRIIVPTLINRDDTHSGIRGIRMTNQPHREFIYRAAYEVGRYIIGFELEKIWAARNWLTNTRASLRPTVVAGYGEGGMLALYAGALDQHVDITLVSGYFSDRKVLPEEPIYRNVWGMLTEFDDSLIAELIAPRTLIIESCGHPQIKGPPPRREGRAGAAPGKLETPALADRINTYNKTRTRLEADNLHGFLFHIISGQGKGQPFCTETIQTLLREISSLHEMTELDDRIEPNYPLNPEKRHTSQFGQLMQYTQHLMNESEFNREEFWRNIDRANSSTWEESCHTMRAYFWEEIIGKLPPPTDDLNPSSRKIYETEDFVGYEIVMDVYDEVFAYGILLIPHGIKPNEKRPVIVCQHGLEGRPQDVADPDIDHAAYHRFACQLAEKGYITYAPQNPHIGENTFREILRKSHPLKHSLYGVIVRQHEQSLRWLSALPYVDEEQMAFYGLSYGGKTAMRIPAILDQYCLSICSADYNEWIWKNMSTRHGYSYLISGEYDMPEHNLANTFNYAEMSWLICPRPFMVERGHDDGVAPDEWVAYEYARTKRHYVKLGIGDKTDLEIFDGPHTIHGKGTFEFLDRHLRMDLNE